MEEVEVEVVGEERERNRVKGRKNSRGLYRKSRG